MDASRRGWVALALGVGAVTTGRILQINSLTDRLYFGKYIEFADALRAGTIVRDRIPDLSPAYLWFIALLRAAGAGVPSIRALQIVLLGCVALIVSVVAMRAGGWIAAVAAAAFILANKAALVNATELEPETMLLFFLAIGLALALRKRPASLFAAGVAFGIAAGFRPVALLAALALAAWLAVQRGRVAALFATGTAIPVVIFLAVNYSLAGSVLLMDPGTVFYEGMNPNATGYSGVAPRIVKDIEPKIPGSDTMHVAYRIVASRALRRPVTREEANRFWTGKSIAFMKEYPARGVALIFRKAILLVSAHDAYDLQSMVMKDRALGPWWISFGVLVPLAIAGAALTFRETLPITIYAICAAASPVAFFVTARHRNPLLIAVAILAAVAIPAILRTRSIAVVALVAIAAIVLSIDGQLQREDDFLWTATIATSQAMERGDIATAATWLPESVPHPPPAVLRAAALRELRTATSVGRQFSIAVALLDADDPKAAAEILERLQALDYKPFRRNREVSSVAYYRACALSRLALPQPASAQIVLARREAPGDADVLALSTFLEHDRRYAAQLDRLHDPFTRDWALSNAAAYAGDFAAARRLAERARAGCPEWFTASSELQSPP